MNILYDMLIYPLEWIMNLILESVLSFTGNPLLSLICVSIAVTVGSLPLYHIAETWQDRERAIQKRLKPKISEFKSVFKGSALNSYTRTLYSQNNYHPIYAVRASFGLLIQIPFFFAAYHLLSNYGGFNGTGAFFFKDLGKPDSLLKLGTTTINLMPFLMTGINILSATVYGKKTTFNEKIQLYGMAALFLIVLYSSSSALLFYWTCNNMFSLIKNLAYSLIYQDGVITREEKSKKGLYACNKEINKIFALSLFSFSFLSFICAPLTVLSSGSGADFEDSLFYFLSYLFVFTAIFISIAYLIYAALPEKWKIFFAMSASFTVFFSLINVFIFTGSYGDMSQFVLNEEITIGNRETVLNAIFGIALFCVVFFVFLKNKYTLLKSVLTIILFSLIVFSVNEARIFSDKRNKPEAQLFDKEKPLFTFSKKGQNVIVIMLDRFIGGYLPQVLEFIPELRMDLDGFVWYKNTLSPASYTIGGVPAIMGGWEYTVREVNSKRTNIPLKKKLDESVRIMPYNFDRAGFDVSVYHSDLNRWFDEDNKENIGRSVFIEPDFPKYRDLWLEKNKKDTKKEVDLTRKKLIAFGIFRIAPPVLRKLIYDKGEWHLEKEEVYKKPDDKKFVSFYEKSQWRRNTTLKYYAVLDFLPEFSRVIEDKNSQFMYMSNDLSHEPYSINSNYEFEITGKISYPRSVYKKFAKNLNALKHLYADAASIKLLNDWILWMKENGVYDNTRLIVVSDHGRAVYNPFFKQQKITGGRKGSHPADYNNLLLVKDFNSHGELKINEEFMSSADVPWLAMDKIIEGKNPYTNAKITAPFNKFPFYTYDIQWRMEKQEKFKYKFYEGYKIEKDVVDNPAKWKVVHE